MSEKEINAYRLTSLEEPTDAMLAYIMRGSGGRSASYK